MTYAENVWWEGHLPHLDLMQVGDALRWLHMWDFDPSPQAQVSVCIYVILLPYLDDIVVLFMGLYGGRMGSFYVPHGMELLYVPHATCFRESIAPAMFLYVQFLTPYGRSCLHFMRALWGQVMDGWVGDHLAHERSLYFVCDCRSSKANISGD